jgi:flagellar biosynthesis protein FlhF
LEVTAALDDKKETINPGPRRMIGEGDQSTRRLLKELSEFDSVGKRREIPRSGQEDLYAYNNKGKIAREEKQSEYPFDIILKNKGNSLINREIDQQWKKILINLEIQESVVESLVNGLVYDIEVKEGSYLESETYIAYFKNKITKLLEPAYKPLPQHKVCTFVGPAGMGKTLTLAKLATHFKLYENKSVALISIFENSRHTGQLETLKYYGNLVDSPVERVTNLEELAQSIDRHYDKDMILIDTVGVNSRNTGMMLQLSKILHSLGCNQDIYLVLSSTTKSSDLMRIPAEFRKLGYTKMIFTKLDETETCGSILNVVCRMGVPVSFVAYGQNVPDDIAAVNPRKLAGLLLGGVDRYVEQGLQATRS